MRRSNHSCRILPVLLAGLLLVSLAVGCLLNAGSEKELQPGPRNYKWTVDSVYSAPGGWMNTIWGSSPEDVWLGSPGGYKKLWHFDGKEWSPYSPNISGDFYSIYGFAQDDVWMGGGEGELWHYDGQEWKLFYEYSPKGMEGPNIIDIWGSSPSDIYAVGTVPTGQENPSYVGFILHYNGDQWKEVLITDFGMQFQKLRKNKKGVYVYGAGPYSTQMIPDSMSFYKVKYNKLRNLYSKSDAEAGSPSMNKIAGKIYFVLENKVMNTKFNSVLPLNITQQDVFGIYGRHEKDMFITTQKELKHYNGENIRDLFQLDHQNATLRGALVLENDVFFLVNDFEAGTNLIYHGTLTENQTEQ